MSEGKVETKPTIVAPRPTETKKAGRAQQTKVPIEVNRPANEMKIFFCKLLFDFNFFYSIT